MIHRLCRRHALVGALALPLAAWLSGCGATVIESIHAHVVEAPILSEPVPREQGLAGYLGVRTGYSSQTVFHALKEGPDNYDVHWNKASVAVDGGLRFDLEPEFPGKPSMADIFFKAGVDPERHGVALGMLGVGLTSSPWLLNLRLATALGVHRYDSRIEYAVVSCGTGCDTLPGETIRKDTLAQVWIWSATLWPTLCDPGDPCVEPYIGAQYGITFVKNGLSFDGTAWTGGLRLSKGPLALVGGAHLRRMQKEGVDMRYWSADARLEYAFRRRK
jgi:hypothetical protein